MGLTSGFSLISISFRLPTQVHSLANISIRPDRQPMNTRNTTSHSATWAFTVKIAWASRKHDTTRNLKVTRSKPHHTTILTRTPLDPPVPLISTDSSALHPSPLRRQRQAASDLFLFPLRASQSGGGSADGLQDKGRGPPVTSCPV